MLYNKAMKLSLLKSILEELDVVIEAENRRRQDEGGLVIGRTQIQVLGQLGLMTHPDFPNHRITLLGTADMDAKVRAEWFARQQLEILLKKHDLELDALANEIWVPDESTFTEVYNSNRIQCEILDPIYVLTSKAIKAKAKNRLLIRDALEEFGKPLEDLIKKYGGTLAYFKEV